GERRNSIPANAVAIVRSEVPLRDEGKVTVKVLSESPNILQNGEKIIDLIDTFRHGVHRMNQEFSIPDVSINFAIIVVDKKGNITAEVSARAMDMVSLDTLTSNTAEIFKAYGFEIKVEDKYPAWKPDITNFTNLIDEKMREVFGKSKLMAIHAGLECGVISTKYPQIKFASIGPTIRYPHSTREMVNIDSVEKIFEVLNRVIRSIQTI
ncbi:MAG: M20/M25/M40 family metallo-hydrolase, partial [Sulfurovum sp.]|nr:M20/M25/M40 family metallo-hydrolase [Sulfurovum sp.]